MRVLFTLQPGVGHFHPLVPLAQALAQRGHDCVFVTSASFAPVVEGAGFQAVAAGLDWTESEIERTFPEIDPTRLDDMLGVWARAFALSGRKLILGLMPTFHRMRPAVVVSESMELCGPLVAELFEVPHATFGIGACYERSVLRDQYAGPWNGMRAALRLPPDPDFKMFCPYLYLDAYPASLHATPPSQTMNVAHPVRPVSSESVEVPPWLGTLDPVPTVCLTMGTVFNRVRGLFQMMLEALRDEPLNVIATVGRNQDPVSMAPGRRGCHIVEYVPYSVLFAHVDGVVSHGGYNTTMAALARGLPMVSLPLTYDQQLTAHRAAECGAALSIPPAAATPPLVREAVRAIVGDARYKKGADVLRREIESMPGPDVAAVLVERLAEERRPLKA